jgi:hypothetical protein
LGRFVGVFVDFAGRGGWHLRCPSVEKPWYLVAAEWPRNSKEIYMRRLAILASVMMMAVVSANCANSRDGGSANIMGPSDVDSAAVLGTMGKGSGGGGKKPGGGTTGGTGTIALSMVTDNNNDGLPSFGDRVTFIVQTTATPYPWVTLRCYQNGSLVYQTSNGIFPTSIGQIFTLGPSGLWTSGAAACTATLEIWETHQALASMSFSTN